MYGMAADPLDNYSKLFKSRRGAPVRRFSLAQSAALPGGESANQIVALIPQIALRSTKYFQQDL
jgi:hypothetical protein